MEEYPIKTPKKDFHFIEKNLNAKGSRVKKLVVDEEGQKAFFKYEGKGYLVSEACSEKMSYEIAKILNYDCARIDLAVDEKGVLGVLNYVFVDIGQTEHIDAIAYLNKQGKDRASFYTVTNIKKTLDELDKQLFEGFIKIMVFDALVGETDRHEENWGIQRIEGHYKFSPQYDNGCNLLREFKNEDFAEMYYSQRRNFDAYIRNSKTLIYKEKEKKKYKHFELIKYLDDNYHEIVKKEIVNLKKLTDEKIDLIVDKLPKELMTEKHRSYIKIYLKKRRDILIEIVDWSDKNEN